MGGTRRAGCRWHGPKDREEGSKSNATLSLASLLWWLQLSRLLLMLVEEMRWCCGGEQPEMELVGKQSRRNEVSFVGLNNARQQTTCKHSCPARRLNRHKAWLKKQNRAGVSFSLREHCMIPPAIKSVPCGWTLLNKIYPLALRSPLLPPTNGLIRLLHNEPNSRTISPCVYYLLWSHFATFLFPFTTLRRSVYYLPSRPH